MLVTNLVLTLKVILVAQSNLERPIIKQVYLRRFLALAGMAGPVMLIAADLTAAFSQPGYNWLRDSISSLAWTPMG